MKRIAVAAARPAVRQSLFWLTLLVIGLAVVPTGAQPADSGEFQLVARDLGVAHPPGYPLYTMAAHLFGRVVLAIPPLRALGWPWAVNAFSMVLAVATLAVVARTAARLGGTWLAGGVAATLLAFAPTFAAQALVANIRMGTGLFTAVVLGLTLSWLAEVGRDGATADDPYAPTPFPTVGGGEGPRVGGGQTLVALCFVGALAAGHHPTLAALALPLGLAIVTRQPAVLRDARLLATCFAAALVGLLPLAYLPIRAAQGAPLAPSDLATAGGVWRHVTAAGFRGDMLAITGARDLGDRLLVLANILRLQFTPLALALIAVGTLWFLARRRAEAVALLGTTLLVCWLAITYRAPQTMEYLLPAYVALTIIAGAAAGVVFRRLRDLPLPQHWGRGPGGEGLRRSPLAAILLAATAAFALPMRGRAPLLARAAVPDLSGLVAFTRDPSCIPSNAEILSHWHFATPMWLSGRRTATDVIAPYSTVSGAPIVYVAPDFTTGDPIGETWRKKFDEGVAAGPVLLTGRTSTLLGAKPKLLGLQWLPLYRPAGLAGGPAIGRSPGWPSRTCLVMPPAAYMFTRTAFSWSPDSSVAITYAALAPFAEDGVNLMVELLVGGLPPEAPVNVVAQLVDPATGQVWAQSDVPVTLSEELPGVNTTMHLALFRGARPSVLHLTVGLYRSTDDGPERLPVYDGPSPEYERGQVAGVIPDVARVDSPPAIRVARVTVPPVEDDPLTKASPLPGAGRVPYGYAMTLRNTTVHRTPTALVADLTWRADARPWASDYTVSVQAAADDGSWRAQHDGTPALGAIPTLKWLPGMTVRDRHRIPLPPEAAGHDGPYTVTVGVYDAFSLEPLPVTDGELVRQGQGQRAIVYHGP